MLKIVADDQNCLMRISSIDCYKLKEIKTIKQIRLKH